MADVCEKTSEAKISKRDLKRLQSEACSKLKCEWCPAKRFTSVKMYDDHVTSKKHKRHKRSGTVEKIWTCKACDLTLPNHSEWMKHLCGIRHSNSLREWGLRLFPTADPLTEQEVQCLDDSSYQEEEEAEEEEEND